MTAANMDHCFFGEHHVCDLCQADDPRPIEAARPYIGDNDPPCVCGNCGFIYVVTRRTSGQVAAAWDDIWGDGYTSAWPAVKARLTYVAEWIDQNIGLRGKYLLDIGAGEGHFLGIVRGMGAGVMGIEPSLGNCQTIWQDGITCYQGTAESIVLVPEQSKHFDIVTINWTLENTGDCIGFLKKAREFLKPDGHLVVATGSRILVPFKKPMSAYFSKNPADTHCFRFSGKSIIAALLKADLHFHAANRFSDSDWLVVSAERERGAVNWNDALRDNPDEVLQFFNDWARMFP